MSAVNTHGCTVCVVEYSTLRCQKDWKNQEKLNIWKAWEHLVKSGTSAVVLVISNKSTHLSGKILKTTRLNSVIGWRKYNGT